MVAVVLTSASLKSLEDTLSPVELSTAMTLEPTLVNLTLCLNVVQQVSLLAQVYYPTLCLLLTSYGFPQRCSGIE